MCSRKQCIADHDVSSHTNEDINSNSTLVQKFHENSKTSVRLTYFDGSSYVKKHKARQTKQTSKKSFVGSSSDTNIRNTITKCKTCCDNADQKSSGSGSKSAADMSDTLPADVCVRMVGGRVREILDLLARSDNDMGCADAYWLQKLFKSVIRALDDLRSACCRPRQITNLRNSCKKTFRLSGAGPGPSMSSSEFNMLCKYPHNVCNQCGCSVNTNLQKLIKAAANFGCLYGYAVNSDKVNRR
ncbi:uncharacterized protein LOC100570274 [Acyrthosiphon pisum]|uniref:Uncharacterized protein n=1 Tax=Acyrthosiphon pisum TaxID=7029 RepID=A0A8R1WAY1_ACYPI|nr:uncharacterized protein LOC100570274 [Acyrthosiphon pisum]|eukprot:XP_003247667.1 PREDICTED: uncharacterized protein LOC100570274 isoform X2 [Acyrthosiphon pisum]